MPFQLGARFDDLEYTQGVFSVRTTWTTRDLLKLRQHCICQLIVQQ